VEVLVVVEVVVKTVAVEVLVTVGVATIVVVVVTIVVGSGVVTCTGLKLPVAGGLIQESRTIPDTSKSRKVNVAARALRLKPPTS
jgi:hypothetical protein